MEAFVNKYRVKDNYTHVTLTYPHAKLNIPPSAVNDLNQLILNCVKNNVDFGVCEVHNDEFAEIIYFDLDFLLTEKVDIDDNDITAFISMCKNIFSKTLKDFDSTCYVFKKPQIEVDNTGYHFKNGLHIYFPNIYLFAKEREHVYQLLVQEAENKKLFCKLPFVNNKMTEIIDHRVIKTNAILKVFCNKPKKQRYRLYQIFNNDFQLVTKKLTDQELLDKLSIQSNSLRNEVNQRRTIFTAELFEEVSVISKSDPLFSKRMINYYPTQDDVLRLVEMLSPQRCQNYTSWINVGLCLHNIDENYLSIWVDWSKNSPQKALKTQFNELWKKFKKRDNGLKYGSLVAWAKIDSPVEFMNFRNEQIRDCIKKSMDFNMKTKPYAIDIARVLKEKFGDIYVCSSLNCKKWYEFRDTIWVEVQGGYTLFNQISDYLIHEYQTQDIELQKQIVDLKGQSLNSDDENVKGNILTKLEEIKISQIKIEKLISALKNTSFKKQIMEEAMPLFFDETFEQNLNEKKNIIVFNNGVYDLDLGCLREGRPSDFMTFSTHVDYKEFDENDPETQKVFHIYSQIHPKEEMRNFFFSTLAVALHGHKMEQKCNIWTGNGSNGKSLTSELCSKALGDFFHSPNITLFTRKAGSSSNASPEKMVLKGRRIGILQEPESDDKLNTSIMKQITGNDIIEARPLYGESIKFKPQISVFLSCNDLPKVPTNDGGTWRRIRVVPFTSKFVNTPTQPHEYKIDPHLSEQTENLAESFISILIHYYNCLKKNKFNIKEPKEVTMFTNEYKNDNDTYQDFASQHLQATNNDKDKVKITELYEMFKDWVKINNPTFTAISKKDFQRQISIKIGEPKTIQSWAGYKIKDCDSEDTTFNVLF